MAKQVVVYYQPECAACHQAMAYLAERGVAYSARNIRAETAALKELIEAGHTTTPVIRVDGQTLVGFDPAALDAALAG